MLVASISCTVDTSVVSMSGEVKDSSLPTLGKCVTYHVFIILEKKN